MQNPYGMVEQTGPSNIKRRKTVGDLTTWMFVSIDINGKVLVNTIQKVMFMYKASKNVLLETKRGESKYQSLATRFSSDLHP